MSVAPTPSDRILDAPLSTEELASIEAMAGLSPVERFDQLVRTVRFILAARQAVSRQR